MSSTPGKIHIETYGCQMNRADSEMLMAMFEEQGYERATSIDEAGVILVNTCIVREHAQEKAITNISQFKRYRENNPDVRIGVLGCMASHTGEMVAKRLPFLDWVIGPDAYRQIPNLLTKKRSRSTVVITEGPSKELYEDIVPSRREGINAWVVITRGCNNFCTYCVVPHARGPERYRNTGTIIDDIKGAIDDGFPQVTLLGQNVNSWRDNNIAFADLLEKVANVDGIKRIRFITSHPKDCSDRLLDVMASGMPICPELHLPLQAGSNNVLKRMGRGYTREHYLGLVEKARNKIDEILLSTDIILGFPGETEEDYQQTEEVVKLADYDDAFVYKYSERPGTAAAKFDDDVPDETKVKRLMKIGDMVRSSGEKRRKAMIGRTLPVLVEGKSTRNPGESMGRTPAGQVVVFPGEVSPGEEVLVTLDELSGFTLRGKRG